MGVSGVDGGPGTDADAVAAALRAHPAVAEAAVRNTPELTAYLVPDEHQAPLLHRACQLEKEGRLEGLCWYEPSPDLLLAQLNRTETDFLYREIFTDRVYLEGGITLPDGAVVLDVGANIGMFSVFAGSQSPGVRVVAVEPVAELARAVEVNAALHSIDVTVVTCAGGREPGEVDFTFYPGNTVMSGRFADPTDTQVLRQYLLAGEADDTPQLDAVVADRMVPDRRRVPVRTLTDIIDGEGLDRVDLLKIDVEKAEADVLAGIDPPTWERIQQIAVEVHDIGGRLAMVRAQLRSLGFTVDVHRPPRLATTPCFNVYGRRPSTGFRPARRPEPPAWPTRSALTDDLRALVARSRPDLPVPDRYALVAELAAIGEPIPGEEAGPPANGEGTAAAVLAEIWAELFGAAAVHDTANFFDLGGDSLTAVRLLARLEDRLGEEVLAPDAVFTAGTFAQLSAMLQHVPDHRP